jgi:hypothetical protein
MFRKPSLIPRLKTVVLAAALLAHPYGLLAQRGAGGGHTGGGTAGGEGLSSTGRATGVDEKDDLKDFHETLAVQATSQQILEYAAMIKSTEAANAELKSLLEQLAKENSASEVASRGAAVERAIDTARSENKKFLDALSDQQKSGLKEIIKRLAKADADLGQQAKALNLEVENKKSAAQQVAASTQSLERALASFKSRQLGLGEEMSIGAGKNGEDSTFALPPVKNSVSFGSQPVVITTSGMIFKGAAEGGQNTFKLELTADLSDLQQSINEVLHTQLDKDERCGERVTIRKAALTPSQPASLVDVQLHFERWSCLGGGQPTEIAEGTGTIEVKLTPSVGADGTLRLTAEIARVEAEGLIGELLRSGFPGETLRDEIMEALLSAIRQGGDFNTTLPAAARANATLRHAQFQGTGSGKLLVVLDGEIRVSNEQAISLTNELKTREWKGRSSTPETVQATVPR